MPSMKHLLFVVLAVVLVVPVHAQTGAGADVILEGKALLASDDVSQMRQARATFERATVDEEHAALAHYYVALAEYRLLNRLNRDDAKVVQPRLDNAIQHLEQAIKIDRKFPDALALLTSFFGEKMRLDPSTGMQYGPRAQQLLGQAMALAPSNPRVVMFNALSTFYTPEMWGGSQQRGLEGFREAAALFEEEALDDPLLPAWGHEEAYAWVGLAEAELGNTAAARTAYEKALAINPAFGWVKYTLLPQLDGKP